MSVLISKQKPERLAKIIASSGLCSRRKAEELIRNGYVQVNGEYVTDVGTNITREQKIQVNGELIALNIEPKLWLFHKPVGVITTHKDPQKRTTVFELLPKNMLNLISVGRLDINSEGLLLLTNNGALARYLEHPFTNLIRKYKVIIKGEITNNIYKKITEGATINGISYKPIGLVVYEDYLIMSLTEGKNREIRRILKHFGIKINKLIRIAYGPFELRNLQPGELKLAPENLLIKCLKSLQENIKAEL